jgi:hypothetical protein
LNLTVCDNISLEVLMRIKNRTYAAILCGLLLTFTLVGWTMSRPAAQRWEYRIIYLKDGNRPDKSQDTINALGSEGWELISVERELVSGSSYDGAAFYFKRQKQ